MPPQTQLTDDITLPGDHVKSLEAFAKAADGKATKIIIPSDIQGLAGNVTAIKELWKDEN